MNTKFIYSNLIFNLNQLNQNAPQSGTNYPHQRYSVKQMYQIRIRKSAWYEVPPGSPSMYTLTTGVPDQYTSPHLNQFIERFDVRKIKNGVYTFLGEETLTSILLQVDTDATHIVLENM